MNISNLKPVNQLAHRFGVKTVLYGGPGSGKTPLISTAPKPVMCVVEPGMLSMRSHTFPAFEAYSADKIDEFYQWFFKSHEAKQFDTLAIDSISQTAEIILRHEQLRNKDGRKAYGEMSTKMMDIINGLYFMPEKHIVLIAKQTDKEESGSNKRRPYFPGQDLNVRVPHLFDEILHLGVHNIPGVPGPQKAICTSEQFDLMARDRSGKLAGYEQPNLGNIFQKAMS